MALTTIPNSFTASTTAESAKVNANFAATTTLSNEMAYLLGIQEGVYAPSDLMVVQRAAGANMSVDVGAGAAWVQDDSSTQGNLTPVQKDTTTNVVVTAAHATLPRIDQVLIDKAGTISVLAGTATAGATLDNRTGAAALSASNLLLADILVGAAAASVTNSTIRDRRAFARGAFYNYQDSTTRTITTATMTALDATNFAARIECTGNPLRVTFDGSWYHSGAGGQNRIAPAVDGTMGQTKYDVAPAAGVLYFAQFDNIVTPSAGSHVISVQWSTTAATATMFGDGGLSFAVEEIVRPSAKNNAVTSG